MHHSPVFINLIPVSIDPPTQSRHISVHSSESIHRTVQSPRHQTIQDIVHVHQWATRVSIAGIAQSLQVTSTEHVLRDGVDAGKHILALGTAQSGQNNLLQDIRKSSSVLE